MLKRIHLLTLTSSGLLPGTTVLLYYFTTHYFMNMKVSNLHCHTWSTPLVFFIHYANFTKLCQTKNDGNAFRSRPQSKRSSGLDFGNIPRNLLVNKNSIQLIRSAPDCDCCVLRSPNKCNKGRSSSRVQNNTLPPPFSTSVELRESWNTLKPQKCIKREKK